MYRLFTFLVRHTRHVPRAHLLGAGVHDTAASTFPVEIAPAGAGALA